MKRQRYHSCRTTIQSDEPSSRRRRRNCSLLLSILRTTIKVGYCSFFLLVDDLSSLLFELEIVNFEDDDSVKRKTEPFFIAPYLYISQLLLFFAVVTADRINSLI